MTKLKKEDRKRLFKEGFKGFALHEFELYLNNFESNFFDFVKIEIIESNYQKGKKNIFLKFSEIFDIKELKESFHDIDTDKRILSIGYCDYEEDKKHFFNYFNKSNKKDFIDDINKTLTNYKIIKENKEILKELDIKEQAPKKIKKI